MKTNSEIKTNFLIIRLSSLGDIVLTTPLIRCMKNAFPLSTIDFVVKKQFEEVIKHNPNINNIFEYDSNDKKSIKNIRNQLQKKDYNIIDLQNNLTSRKIRTNIGLKCVKFDKKLLEKIALVWCKKNLFDGKSIPERYIETAHPFNIKNDNNGLEIWLPEEKIQLHKNKIPINTHKVVISIAPAAMHKTKQWLPEYFIELIEKINETFECEFNLLGGNDANEICNMLANNSNAVIKNYAGKTSILDLARILDKSDVLISNDTGIMHIGAARQVPIVAIYGSTTTDFGFSPYKTPHKICEVQLKCRPCSHIGKKSCPKKHFNCMKLLEPEIVFKSVEEFLTGNIDKV